MLKEQVRDVENGLPRLPWSRPYLSHKSGWLAGQQPGEGWESSLRQHLGAKFQQSIGDLVGAGARDAVAFMLDIKISRGHSTFRRSWKLRIDILLARSI